MENNLASGCATLIPNANILSLVVSEVAQKSEAADQIGCLRFYKGSAQCFFSMNCSDVRTG